MKASTLFSEDQKKRMVQCIADAELMSSGEIRLHMEDRCKADPYERALQVFHQLNMHQTEQRNGVLLYIAVQDKKLAIVGDRGIHEVVQQIYWDKIIDHLKAAFKQGQYFDAIAAAIHDIGQQLKQYFPIKQNDRNELSNDISIG